MSFVHHSHCPVCYSSEIKPALIIRDHSVSKEEFSIWQCTACTVRFTQDAPDAASISPYYASPEYISHSNTNTGLINKLYQKVRKRTLEQKAALVISCTKPRGHLLDVGAGIGAFLSGMQHHHWTITGIEPDAGARANAQQTYGVSLQDADKLATLPEREFDAITLWHVLEHVHALQPTLAQLKLLLKEEGSMFIAVPNYTSLDASTYKNVWAAYDVPRHLYHFTPTSMAALLQQHGLRIVATKPMWFDSFYISLLSSKYLHGNPSLPGAIATGLLSNLKALGDKNKCSSLIYVIKKA